MPIQGLTANTEPTTLAAGLPELGRLYKGAPKTGNRPGADLDYFRVKFNDQFKHLQSKWDAIYGAEPYEFEGVYLLGRDADEAFSTWYENWSKTALLSRCDGKTQIRHFANGRYSDTPRPCQCNPDKRTCKQIGRLAIVIRPFDVFGYFMLVTHSIHDILEIHNTLRGTLELQKRLIGIPFVLGRHDKSVSMPKEDGTRVTVEKSLIYLHPDPSYTDRAMQMLESGDAPQLSSQASIVAAASGINLAQGAGLLMSGANAFNTSIVDDNIIDAEPPEEVQPEQTDIYETDVKSVSVMRDKDGFYLKLTASLLNKPIYVRTRAPFIEAGWIVDTEWKALGKYDLKPFIPIKVKRDGDQWTLVSVHPNFGSSPADEIPL